MARQRKFTTTKKEEPVKGDYTANVATPVQLKDDDYLQNPGQRGKNGEKKGIFKNLGCLSQEGLREAWAGLHCGEPREE